MSNVKIVLVLLCLTAISAIIAQPPCQPRIFTVQAGQRFCERQCITGPGTGGTRCATARVTTTVRLCPMNCCRRGSICQWVYQA